MNIEPAPGSQGRVNSTASSPTLNPAFTKTEPSQEA